MELGAGGKASIFASRRRWVLFAALGFGGYAAFRIYNSPAVARKRKRMSKLCGALVSMAKAFACSSEAVCIFSNDLRDFMLSESDQIPNSFTQISKIARSDEFYQSLSTATEAVATGLIRGHGSKSAFTDCGNPGPGFLDQVMDKLFTKAGTAFASALVGSFARNLLVSSASDDQKHRFHPSASDSKMSSIADTDKLSQWIDALCTPACRTLLGDCIQVFVSTAVAVHLEKTKSVNTYDDFFSGLTNPEHQTRVKDVLVAVCNGTVETLVKTNRRTKETYDRRGCLFEKSGNFKRIRSDSSWVGGISSSIAMPSNRRFIVDLSGRMTFDTVGVFLALLVEKINKSVKSCVDSAIDTGVEAVRNVSLKSFVVPSICISLCLQILEAPWLLVPRKNFGFFEFV